MADTERYADDIAQLWGPREEAVVEPAADPPAPDPIPAHAAGNGSTNGNGIGSHAVEKEQPHDVARLAEAIASRRLAGASRGDLEAMRSELEATFAQQLATAVYELMTVSNERLATLEEHMNRQLSGVREAVGEQVGRLAGSLDSHHLAAGEEYEALRSQLGAVRAELAGLAAERAVMSAALEQNVGGVAQVSAETGALADRVTEMQAEIAALHRVVADLGDTVTRLPKASSRERERARRRRGWSSTP